MLASYADAGYHARSAIARALATADATGVSPDAVEHAMSVMLAEAERLRSVGSSRRGGLFAREVRYRVSESAARTLDLASVLGDRDRIAKARSALLRGERARGDALELLENVLPKAFASRTVALLEVGDAPPSRAAAAERVGGAPELDAWLKKCHAHDARGKESDLPSQGVDLLDKLLILSESRLFDGMSSEDLYPVGQIAEARELSPGEPLVVQGDPGDAVFIVVSGTFEVTRDGQKLREVSRGAVVGEIALLDGAPRSASVTALTEARVLRIPRAEFEALLDESPEIARGIIRTLLAHLRGEA
jgi:Cyclic nucleotide-binding domain